MIAASTRKSNGKTMPGQRSRRWDSVLGGVDSWAGLPRGARVEGIGSFGENGRVLLGLGSPGFGDASKPGGRVGACGAKGSGNGVGELGPPGIGMERPGLPRSGREEPGLPRSGRGAIPGGGGMLAGEIGGGGPIAWGSALGVGTGVVVPGAAPSSNDPRGDPTGLAGAGSGKESEARRGSGSGSGKPAARDGSLCGEDAAMGSAVAGAGGRGSASATSGNGLIGAGAFALGVGIGSGSLQGGSGKGVGSPSGDLGSGVVAEGPEGA